MDGLELNAPELAGVKTAEYTEYTEIRLVNTTQNECSPPTVTGPFVDRIQRRMGHWNPFHIATILAPRWSLRRNQATRPSLPAVSSSAAGGSLGSSGRPWKSRGPVGAGWPCWWGSRVLARLAPPRSWLPTLKPGASKSCGAGATRKRAHPLLALGATHPVLCSAARRRTVAVGDGPRRRRHRRNRSRNTA